MTRARCLLAALACLALGLAALALLPGCAPAETEARYQPTVPLVVSVPYAGTSMLPTLPAVGLAPIDVAYAYDRLQLGDIVLLWDYTRGGYTLHRIIARQGQLWITQGDNPATNPIADRPFLFRANFIGRYAGNLSDL